MSITADRPRVDEAATSASAMVHELEAADGGRFLSGGLGRYEAEEIARMFTDLYDRPSMAERQMAMSLHPSSGYRPSAPSPAYLRPLEFELPNNYEHFLSVA